MEYIHHPNGNHRYCDMAWSCAQSVFAPRFCTYSEPTGPPLGIAYWGALRGCSAKHAKTTVAEYTEYALICEAHMITEQIRHRHRQGNRPGNRSGVVRDWSSGNQKSSRRTAAGAEPRGIICRRQTQPGGVHLHRDIDLYYLRGQLHAAAAEFRAADYPFPNSTSP